jgi:heat shock protein HslJ
MLEFKSFIAILLFFLPLDILLTTNPANAASNKPVYSKEIPPKLSDIRSLTFLSTYVTVNGKRHLLASKDRISLRLDEKNISVSSGCNTLEGKYSLSKGVIISQILFKTKKACSEKLFNQDLWLSQLFSSKPKIMVQFISPNSKVSAPSMILTVYSKLSPALKVGKSVIKMEIKETYGYADSPLGDENSTELLEATCSKLLLDKASESDAQFAAEQKALLFRVTSRDGDSFALTKDYIINRMNVVIMDGKVSECYQG